MYTDLNANDPLSMGSLIVHNTCNDPTSVKFVPAQWVNFIGI